MRQSYAVLIALCVNVFVIGTSEYSIAGVLPRVGADLAVSVATAGQAVTAYALGVVVGGPLVTIAVVRLPRRGAMAGLMLWFAAGSVVSAWAPSFELLVAGRVMASMSHAAFLALAMVTATRVVPVDRAGTAIAAVASGFTVATLLGVPLGALLGERAGWRAPFVLLAVLAVVGAVVVAAVLPAEPAARTDIREELRTVLRRPVLMSIATTAVGVAGAATVFTYIAPLLTRVTGFATSVVSVLLLAYGAGSVVGNIAAGRFTDRSLSTTVRAVFGGSAAVLLLFPFLVEWRPTAVLAVLLLGLLATATIAPLQGLSLACAGGAPTLAVSVDVGAFNLGAALGSMLGGLIVAAGALRWTGPAGALLSLVGLALSFVAIPRSTAAPAVADDAFAQPVATTPAAS